MADKTKTTGEFSAFGRPLPYACATPAAARRAVRAACANLRGRAAACGGRDAHGWNGTVAPLECARERLDREFSLLQHMRAVAGSPGWDAAHDECVAKVARVSAALGQHAGLYRNHVRLRDSAAGGKLGKVRRRILDESISSFEDAGVALPSDKRRVFRAGTERLAALCAAYERNLRDATADGHVTTKSAAALEHMPADLREAHADPAGGWRFGLLDPSYLAFLRHCSDRRLRKRMHGMRNARASELGPARRNNLPLMREILALRCEQARMLGHANHAELCLRRRMAGSPQAARELIGVLADPARKRAAAELAELADYAASELGIRALAPWDLAYAAERLRVSRLSVCDAQMRQYFGRERIVTELLKCAHELFGVRARRCRVPVWNSEVVTLELSTGGGARRGLLYLDLGARSGKLGGAWAHPAAARCRFGALQQPAVLVNCNFSEDGARMSWSEVVTLFHEVGHALHHVLTCQEEYSVSGFGMVEWDAVELPSQFMENFAWESTVIRSLSAHERTGKPLPMAAVRRLRAVRTFQTGMNLCRQLTFAAYDLELHCAARTADPLRLWKKVRERYLAVPAPSRDRTPCGFAHIFSGGYDAGYYSYLWAEVLSADAYAMFRAPRADREKLGRRFLSEILARGGSRPAAENFRALRGRDPDVGPLLRQLGIA